MNVRKLVLGLAVVFAAMGYAFASASAFATPAFVRVKLSGAANFVCVNTQIMCSETGANTCRIQIPDLGRSTPAYRTNACGALTTNVNISAGSYDPATVIVDADL